MELLLTLFAMLGAVTGVFSGVRGPEAQVHQAEAAATVEAIAAVAEAAVEPIVAVIPANDGFSMEVVPLPAFALSAAIPLYADRLIE